jgi:hypothetical protein
VLPIFVQAPNCMGSGACGRFGSTIWYTDSMCAKAAAGYAAYARQVSNALHCLPHSARTSYHIPVMHSACVYTHYCNRRAIFDPCAFVQDFIGADYGLVNYTTFDPSTDYWLLAVWKAAGIGRAVLEVTPPAVRTLRAYAFCGSRNATAVLVLINLNPSQPMCVAPPSFLVDGEPLTQYSLTPTDGSVTSALANLGGDTLRLQVSR